MEDVIVDVFTFEDFVFFDKILSSYQFTVDDTEDFEHAKQLRLKVKELLSHIDS
jgi:hypothetical protein